jgi:hypothetical protein
VKTTRNEGIHGSIYNRPNLAHDKNFHKKNTRIEGRDLSIHKTNQKRITKKFLKKNHKNQRKNSIHPSTHKTASARSPNSHNKKTKELKG